jgi:hypothetical protein
MEDKKYQKKSLQNIDLLGSKELREYAKVITVQNERLKVKLKHAHETHVKIQEAYQRLKQENERLKQELEESIRLEEARVDDGFKEEQLHKNTKQIVDVQSESEEEAGSLRKIEQTPVSETQLTASLPSNMKLAHMTQESQSMEDGGHLEQTPVNLNRHAQGRNFKSPPWESIKRKPRHVTEMHRLDAVDVPAPEQMGAPEEAIDHDRAFKYYEVIRKKDDRAKLPAGFCSDCARFYKAYAEHGDLAKANELVKRLCGHNIHQQTSRHRRKHEPPPTPPDYWDIQPLQPHS